MQKEKYWASKVPLPLALLFLVNIFVIVGAQLLFFYKFPVQPDEMALTKYDAVYEDCEVFNQDSSNYLTASLVTTTGGQTHLVVTKGHSIAFGRGKIIYAEPVKMSESGEVTVYVKNGIHTAEIVIKDIPTGVWSVTIQYGYSGSIKEVTAFYMVLAAALEALELLVVHFIKQNLQ